MPIDWLGCCSKSARDQRAAYSISFGKSPQSFARRAFLRPELARILHRCRFAQHPPNSFQCWRHGLKARENGEFTAVQIRRYPIRQQSPDIRSRNPALLLASPAEEFVPALKMLRVFMIVPELALCRNVPLGKKPCRAAGEPRRDPRIEKMRTFLLDDCLPKDMLLRRRKQDWNIGSAVTCGVPARCKPGTDAVYRSTIPAIPALLNLVRSELFSRYRRQQPRWRNDGCASFEPRGQGSTGETHETGWLLPLSVLPPGDYDEAGRRKMLTQEETISALNDLIQVCKDGEQGYRTAAENVKNSELETMFRGYAKQRAEFARELQAEVKRLGGEPADSGNVGAVLHRGWMDVKSALTGGDPGSIIAACEGGDENANAAYSRVASTDVSGKTRVLVDKQWQQIKEAQTRTHRLKTEIQDGTRFPANE